MTNLLFWSMFIRLVPIACPFFIFMDYHIRRNVHRSVAYVGVFFTTMYVVSNLSGNVLLWISMTTPVWLFSYVAFVRQALANKNYRPLL